jgi:hypothetical protein
MIRSSARMPTEHAREYLSTLTSFARLTGSSAVDDDAHALLQLPKGYSVLEAREQFLDIAIYASSMSDVMMLEDIVSDQLDAIASGEELRYQWVVAPEPQNFVFAANAPARRRQP